MRREDYFCPACGAENFGTVYDSPNENVYENTYYGYSEQRPVFSEEEQSKDRRYGLGGAITAAVMAAVSTFMLFIALVLGELGESTAATVINFLMAVPGVLALVFGFRSITAFRKNVSEGRAKPIATLIMGIVGATTGIDIVMSVVLELMTYMQA